MCATGAATRCLFGVGHLVERQRRPPLFFSLSFFLNFSSVVGVFALFHFHSTHSVDGAFFKNTCYLYNSSLSLFLSRL